MMAWNLNWISINLYFINFFSKFQRARELWRIRKKFGQKKVGHDKWKFIKTIYGKITQLPLFFFFGRNK